MRRAGWIATGALGLASLGLAGYGAAQEANRPDAAPTAATAPPTPSADAVPPPPPLAATTPAQAVQTPDEAPVPAAEAPPKAVPVETPDTADDKPPPPEPLKRPRFDAAILQGVDKITAETLRFEAKVGEPVRYKGLVLTVHACEQTASDEAVEDSMAHIDVQSQPEGRRGVAVAARQVFRGWIFASSPTLHPVEHATYDLWLITCRAASPVV